MFRSRTTIAAVALMFVSSNALAQASCVDYDSRYPVTTNTGKQYFWNPIWNFSPMKMQKVSGLNIGGDNYFNGMLQYVPPSYNNSANANKKYPVIISFHGGAAKGNGSSLELCRLFKDRGADSAGHKTFPGRVERNTSHLTQSYNGVTYEYIVVAPQFNKYIWPEQFPSAKQVENVIDFVVQRFRIDTRRIYLTGYSSGANMIIEYAGSSLARAKRVAAIMPVALCSQLGGNPGIYAKNIGLAKLKTWFVYCESDNCGKGPALKVPDNWVDSIMKVSGAVTPRYTRLRNVNPATLYNCSDSLLHDAWSRAFDPNFRASHHFNGGNNSAVNDGINLNMYQWFIRQTNTDTPPPPPPPEEPEEPEEPETPPPPPPPPPPEEPEEPDTPPVEPEEPEEPDTPPVEPEEPEEPQEPDTPPVEPELPEEPEEPQNPPPVVVVPDTTAVAAETIVQFSPNPFTGSVTAKIRLAHAQKITIIITNLLGRTVSSYTGNHLAGSSQVEIFVNSLSTGIYFIQFQGKEFSRTEKILKR